MTDSAPGARGTSTSDVPDRPGWLKRTFDEIVDRIDHSMPWYKLPKPLGLIELIGIRNTLREKNLYDTSRSPAVDPVQAPPFEERFRTQRNPDGSWNDLEHPEMGMAGTRFGRNVPIEATFPDAAAMLTPSPREISRRLMTRDELVPATAG